MEFKKKGKKKIILNFRTYLFGKNKIEIGIRMSLEIEREIIVIINFLFVSIFNINGMNFDIYKNYPINYIFIYNVLKLS